MKLAKLKRHLKAKHKEFAKKLEIYFRSMAGSVEKGSKLLKKYTSIPEKALRASFEVSYLTGKNMKPHTIGESLILPAALKITSTMLGEKYLSEINTIPLSNDTISRRIRHISLDIEKTLIDRLQNSPIFALQLDETTDISKFSQLIVYVRYIYKEKILEDFLFCKKLEERASGGKIFELVNNYFKRKQVNWSKCSSICTDGAASLTGIYKGFFGLLKQIAPHIEFLHCLIHSQALVSKDIDKDSNKTFQDVITAINYKE